MSRPTKPAGPLVSGSAPAQLAWASSSAGVRTARHLPHVVVPVEGESFASWIDRVAADLDVSGGHAALALGLPTRMGAGTVRPRMFGIAASAPVLTALSTTTGLREAEVRAMHLERFAGGALDFTGLDLAAERTLTPLVGREWALFHASRACAACLAESGGVWPLWWRLGIAAVCPVHAALLVEACPTCGIALRRGQAGRVRGLTRRGVADPLRCGNLAGSRACAQDLTALATRPAPKALVRIQQAVLDVAFGTPAILAGVPGTAAEFFGALRALTALARFAADPQELRGLAGMMPEALDAFAAENAARAAVPTGAAKFRAMPASPAVCAAVLTAVAPSLLALDEDGAAAALRPWAEAAQRQRELRGHHNPLRAAPLPEQLGRILAKVTPSRHRLIGAQARLQPRRAAWETRHIPHLVNQDDYIELVFPHLPRTSALEGRRIAALALARVAGAPTWREAAQSLGMDRPDIRALCDRAAKRIADPDAFWTAVLSLGARLAGRGLIDFAARRAALAGLLDVPASALAGAARRAHLPITPARRRLAAAWLWTDVTSGDYRDAPALTQGWEAATTASRRTSYQRFATALPAAWAQALTGHGIRLLTKKGIA